MPDWTTETSEIARDLGRHTSEQVAATIGRSLAICSERGEVVAVATAGVLAALEMARGAYAGLLDLEPERVSLRNVADGVLDAHEEAQAR